MSKTILVCGHGPGISDAVARKFGSEGFKVALVARSAERLEAAAASLRAANVEAHAFPTDLGDPAAVTAMVQRVRGAMGSVTVVHWNAYLGAAGDLLAAPPAELHRPFDVAVTGLVAAVQAAHADLKSHRGAVLVTGGGFAFYDPKVDASVAQWKAAGLAISKAAQHKAVGILNATLKDDGIYVGELVVLGLVKGTAFDHGNATLDPHAIAARFWEMYGGRSETTANFA
jgi:NADP-dependent 3-hydroxy acid dehydrogenase YdfG